MFCDLHLHSTNSDGRDAPETVVDGVSRAGLAVMSLTDHSGVSFDADLVRHARSLSLGSIPGVEISTVHETSKYHVLAYGPGVLDAALREFAFRPTAVKNRIYAAVLQELRAGGTALPPDAEILAGIDAAGVPRHPGKWMMGSTLIAGYLAPAQGIELREARARVKTRYDELKHDEPDRYVPTEEAVARVREAGALPVLAHPFWECSSGRNDWAGVVDHMRRFAELGLVGAEVSSRHSSPGDEAARRGVVEALGLVPFRSSDYHANGKTVIGQFPMRVGDLLLAADLAGVDLTSSLGPQTEAAV